MENLKNKNVTEKILNPMNGFAGLFILLFVLAASVALFIASIIGMAEGSIALGLTIMIISCLIFTACCVFGTTNRKYEIVFNCTRKTF